ncbi:MAG: hypothetical protein AVDCRST_MAG68-5097 [uncultured Gemmatimonadetes bacterium]|uniref:GmrSD restriction endonucleases N-terminal domain-containing protein n=1 Tax=uncultured Gemmatimonadota bacterium TaxID=203437 RepID=A0A6J4MP79_9BACT|nr:MAG: hypothetical protein AVDCRST_MAG68-5097 [uncultured Gemmatimonadota bacterium]
MQTDATSAARPSFQTSEPVTDLRMEISGRSLGELVRWIQDGDATYDLPYQRGAVWTDEQRIMLILSMLSGTPVPALIINDRPQRMWFDADGERLPIYAVIDGKQRLTTFRMFMENDLLVPASWFAAEEVKATEDTEDGPYVRYSGLTRRQQLFFERIAVPVAVGKLGSVREEAAVYLRVNGSGTPQSDEDMTRAARVAAGA